jgi:bifunctional ADP-heptose synthase (sugar kinase/adenylyltransferase)
VLAAVNDLAGFVDNVTLLSVLGTENDYGDFVRAHVKGKVEQVFFEQPDVPTVVKRRFVDPTFTTKMFEVCYLGDPDGMSRGIENDVVKWLDEHIAEYDMVLVADFGHGMITPRINRVLTTKAPFLALNVQSNSANMGFNYVTKYARADFVCIDEPELRLASHDRISGIESLIVKMSKKMKCDHIIITTGHRGAVAYSAEEGFTRIPVFSTEVVDRIGAGDAFSAITGPCVLRGLPMATAGFVGNAVGAMQVLTVGNRTAIDPTALFKYVVTLLK